VTSPALLTLAGVGKRYRQGELVLNGVELEMERGRVRGIIGTNGSGKSTLLRSLPEFSRE
jgi:ABC-type multidrug transport system ATPase subunit